MMTTIDYKALAKRVELYAELSVEGCDFWRTDLRTVVTLLEGMADARPIAFARRDLLGAPYVNGWDDDIYALRGDIKLFLHPAPQPQPNPSMLESHRRLVERAIQDAERPSGMTTHDGKARIDASVLRRMLAIIDTQPQPCTDPMSLAVALDFADNPRPYHTLQAPADTNGELYRALRVLAAAYRAALAAKETK